MTWRVIVPQSAAENFPTAAATALAAQTLNDSQSASANSAIQVAIATVNSGVIGTGGLFSANLTGHELDAGNGTDQSSFNINVVRTPSP